MPQWRMIACRHQLLPRCVVEMVQHRAACSLSVLQCDGLGAAAACQVRLPDAYAPSHATIRGSGPPCSTSTCWHTTVVACITPRPPADAAALRSSSDMHLLLFLSGCGVAAGLVALAPFPACLPDSPELKQAATGSLLGESPGMRVTGDASVQHVTASNVIVSASGMSEAMAKGLSDEFLGELPTASKVTPPPSVYVGGGSSEHSASSCTAVVAFESPGWSDMKKAMLSTVVRTADADPPAPPPFCTHACVIG